MLNSPSIDQKLPMQASKLSVHGRDGNIDDLA